MNSRLESQEPAAHALGRLLHESGERVPRSGADPELDRLLDAVAERSSAYAPRRGARKWTLVVAAAAVVCLAVGLEWHRRENAALTFSANGVPGHVPGAVAANSERPVDLEFSDGSVFNVESTAKIRVESSSPNGAHVTLVEGRTIAHVVHRSKTSWSVTAGPFEVQVTGTRFGASWDVAKERLSVELYDGSVQVVGGGLAAPIAVRAGQRLEAEKGAGNWLLTSLAGPSTLPATKSAPPVAAEPPSAEQTSTTDPSADTSAPAATNRSAAPTLDWPAMLGRADFDGIVRQANDYGLERCLSTCAPSELRILADSARYLGRYALAERSLLALRKRSPTDAANAAFLLARLAESQDAHKALDWYERNLKEAPTGAYAAEALAGKMRMLLSTGGPSAAAPAATQYLERFPDGVHASKAHDILSQSRAPGDRR